MMSVLSSHRRTTRPRVRPGITGLNYPPPHTPPPHFYSKCGGGALSPESRPKSGSSRSAILHSATCYVNNQSIIVCFNSVIDFSLNRHVQSLLHSVTATWKSTQVSLMLRLCSRLQLFNCSCSMLCELHFPLKFLLVMRPVQVGRSQLPEGVRCAHLPGDFASKIDQNYD
jgi:hypothetical protein